MSQSLAQIVAALSPAERDAVFADLDMENLAWDWNFWARPEQVPPPGDDWSIWLYLAGRGAGKTRAAAEWMRDMAKRTDRGVLRFALVARTAADVRDVIVEGESGIINVSPPSERPLYEPSKRRLTWPNGNTATCFCVTPDTEALTRDRGWVFHSDLQSGDTILTLNVDTGMSEWNVVDGVHRFNVIDEPVASFTGRYHKSTTTLAHRWPVSLRNGNIIFTTTNDIVNSNIDSKARLITAAECADIPVQATHSNALVELAAWFMTEGTVRSKTVRNRTNVKLVQLTDQPGWDAWLTARISSYRGHASNDKPHITKPTQMRKNGALSLTKLQVLCDQIDAPFEDAMRFYGTTDRAVTLDISQSPKVNPDKCAMIERALVEMFGQPRNSSLRSNGKRVYGKTWRLCAAPKGRTVAGYHLDSDAAAEVLKHFDDVIEKVPSRKFILSLTRQQLELFMARCIDGDGHRRGRHQSMGQKSILRDDRFALVLTLLGIPYSQFVNNRPYKNQPYRFYSTSTRRSRFVLIPREINEVKKTTNLSRHRIWSPGRATFTIKQFTGVVWCPTVKNKTWLARKDGMVFFTGNTADEPDGLRGPQFHYAWADEVAAWRQSPDAAGMTSWDNLRVACRLGDTPQIICTTTPKRVPVLYGLIDEAKKTGRVVISKGTTFDNVGNLSTAYIEAITGVYEGTRLAAQELEGEMLSDVEGALWTIELIERSRQNVFPTGALLRVVGVDPSVAENPRDECGIIVCASTGERDLYRRHAWVLEDATVHGSPEQWASAVVAMARKYGCPVVAEVNQGGALVTNAIQSIDPTVKVFEVHSKYGKALRAEPVVLAYEQNRIHHVDYLQYLESQMCTWIPGEGKSPDRVDALVHAATALLIKPPPGFIGGTLRAKSHAHRRLPSWRGASNGGMRIAKPR